MNATIGEYIKTAIENENTISEERKAKLTEIAQYISGKIAKKETVNLNFICTHNSRRSHLAQVWAFTMCQYFNIKNFYSYSGGLEITKVYPTVIKTFEEIGFEITGNTDVNNPIYKLKSGDKTEQLNLFSKEYNDLTNPHSGFIAIMVCTDADGNCPYISECEKRFLLPYQDPKIADNTPDEEKIYHERSLQIATEMAYLFKLIKPN